MVERRKSPRVRCRIRCSIARGSDRASGCILDVSDGGLCLLSPAPVKQDESFSLEIDVPKLGIVTVRALAWHVRRVRGATSKKRAWSIGAVIVEADAGYTSLLEDAAHVASASRKGASTVGGVDADELTVFKVRVQQRSSPRTKLLSLTAKTEDEAHRLATRDLDDTWSVVDVVAA